MSKVLVAYFSAGNRTANAAKQVADILQADIFEIKPAVPYTSADLDWRDSKSRSSIEMQDKSSRPEIAEKLENMSDYDVIVLGFPIWWYVAPAIVNTFLEQYDMSGKKIVLFATSGSSGLGETAAALKVSVDPSCTIVDGGMLNNGVSEAEVKSWV